MLGWDHCWNVVWAALLFGCLFASHLPVYAQFRSANHSYNTILISVDTMAADHFDFLGYSRETSPYLSDCSTFRLHPDGK